MGLVQDGDQVVIAAGSPPGRVGSTNSLKVHKVGDLAHSTRAGEVTSTKETLGPWPEKKKKNFI